jgi:CheY-like chemotaxis protein
MTAAKRDILVVDDDDHIRLLVTKVLQSAGYQVREATNGLEALKMIDAAMPDLVISDIMMPELDGLGLATGLRHHPATATLPIIFITASDNPSHFTESIRLKARHFVNKPFTNDKLLAKVAQVLDSKS